MTLKGKLILISSIFAVGFVISGVFSETTLNQVKVNGPIYDGIVQQKDLLADILPPPEYLVESYLVTEQMLEADKNELPALVEKSKALERDFEDRHQYWLKELPDGEAKTLLVEKAYTPAKAFLDLQQKKLIPALERGDQQTVDSVRRQLKQKYTEHRAAIDELVKVSTAAADQQAKDAQETVALKSTLSIALVVVFLGIGGVVAWWATRSVLRQLGGDPAYAAEIANGMARGELKEIQLRGGDTSSLLAAMKSMVEMFRGFVSAQGENAKQHEAGMLDHKIPAESFPGVYGEMAKSINVLVQSHIAVKMKVVEVVKRYALGDLSPDMDRLPGQKAQITEAIDGVKASMKAVNGQIRGLVDAAVAGDFKARGEADKFQYEFKEMIDGLNRLMEVSDVGLGEVSRILDALAKGDLTQRIDGNYQGTFGKLQDDSNTTVARLQEVVGRIKDATEAIDTAAKEIAAGNQDLSSRTEEQASSLEETASSMEELNATVKQNAENAKQANELAKKSNDAVSRGGEAVKRVVTTMGDIQGSSKKIADIIGVIDSIAFQTNILALNAAVEAARAGEQGRGFAVVATEVRNLAQRSATAAKEIKGLIAESVEKVEGGAKLVNQAGTAMDEVVASFQQVAALVTEISGASREQSSGIEQVTQAVSQMDEVTQQNAALVEEAAAAAESLEEQARGLVQAVGLFRMPATTALTRQAHAGAGATGGIDFSAAIDAHKKWKQRLLAFVADIGNEHLDPAVVGSDDKCTLGQWIHGTCKPAMGGDTRCQNLVTAHANFHRSAGEVIRHKLEKNKKEAMAVLKGAFTKHSEETIRFIENMQSAWSGRGAVSGPSRIQPVARSAIPPRLVHAEDEWQEF